MQAQRAQPRFQRQGCYVGYICVGRHHFLPPGGTFYRLISVSRIAFLFTAPSCLMDIDGALVGDMRAISS